MADPKISFSPEFLGNHEGPLLQTVAVEILPSFSGFPESLVRTLRNERRERARYGTKALMAILSKDEAIKEAEIDPTTGLANRRVFDRVLSTVTSRMQVNNDGVRLFLFDLRGLKRVNDSRGLSVGDGYLAGTAKGIVEGLRPTDRVCRVGGDELAALVTGIEAEEDVEKLVARLRGSVDRSLQPLELGPELYTGISVGSHLIQPGQTASEVFIGAGEQMSLDKNRFDSQIPRQVLEQDPRRI